MMDRVGAHSSGDPHLAQTDTSSTMALHSRAALSPETQRPPYQYMPTGTQTAVVPMCHAALPFPSAQPGELSLPK